MVPYVSENPGWQGSHMELQLDGGLGPAPLLLRRRDQVHARHEAGLALARELLELPDQRVPLGVVLGLAAARHLIAIRTLDQC